MKFKIQATTTGTWAGSWVFNNPTPSTNQSRCPSGWYTHLFTMPDLAWAVDLLQQEANEDTMHST